jgi:hypothetical protein
MAFLAGHSTGKPFELHLFAASNLTSFGNAVVNVGPY